MWDHMYQYHDGGGWFGGPFMLILLIVVIVAVVMVVIAFSNSRHYGRNGHSDPLTILKERYARGEIDVQEYEERKRNLEK